jgi:hypothetical protein
MKYRAEVFRYVGLDVTSDTLTGNYELDGRPFQETVTFEGIGPLTTPAVRAVAQLWYLIAGLSYYKAGAAKHVDLGTTPVGVKGRKLFDAALRDGLGEFSYRNELYLDDVVIEGGFEVEHYAPLVEPSHVLTPFGGGIDSVVTVSQLSGVVLQSLFIVSPASGVFEPLERTAAITGLPIVRARRSLDPQILSGDETFFNGHVPVTTMVTLLAVVAAIAAGRGAVAMSNEHSASAPNLVWNEREINHQWSKSWVAEELIADAVRERVGNEFVVASYLRNRSELWVAKLFAGLPQYHHVFRSCNRAFAQASDQRAANWCGQCDKCLFINLILAPFLSRSTLRDIFASEPLTNPELAESLRTLVGIGVDHKPFECVGDPDESALALRRIATLDEWADEKSIADLALLVSPDRDFDELLLPEGPSHVPPHWLR